MPGALFLEGDEINLRTIEKEDLEFLTNNINHPKVGKNVAAVFKPRNKQQQKQFFEDVISSDEGTHLAISKNEEIKGIATLNPEDNWNAKIGLWITKEAQGEGYGTEAASKLIKYAFDQLNYHRIYARTLDTNKASQKLWEKHGFQKEGELREHIYRDGEYHNLILYGLLKEER